MMNIDFKKIESIKLSLMKKESDIDKDNRAVYESYASCTFNIPVNFFGDLYNSSPENLCASLLEALYIDITNQVMHDDRNYLGMWVDYDGNVYENAIEMKTLDNIKEYGDENVNPLYEFFKMTVI